MLDLRNSKNVPIWCGESGENSNHWYADAIRLLETNDIGWSWWTWKKIGSANGMNMVKAPSGYKTLKKYWQEGGTKPSQDFATNTMFELADGSITPLTAEDLQAIMRDVAAWEMAVQGAKQACWGAIDAATSEEEISAALATLAEELKQ